MARVRSFARAGARPPRDSLQQFVVLPVQVPVEVPTVQLPLIWFATLGAVGCYAYLLGYARWMEESQRVPRYQQLLTLVGFALAIAYLVFSRPTRSSLIAGGAIALIGLTVRAWAAGCLDKGRSLTVGGPYAYTRNPLYLGSIIIASGFALCARNWWIAGGIAAIFLAVYLPVISAEEAYLRSEFPAYQGYSQRVPRLFPRFSPAPSDDQEAPFSRELYLKHREYNSLLGAAGVILILAGKIIWFNR